MLTNETQCTTGPSRAENLEIHAPADCPVNGSAATRARMQRARQTRHQARLVKDGQILVAGPWRSDHLDAVCDRTRIREYMQDHGVVGQAQIASAVKAVKS